MNSCVLLAVALLALSLSIFGCVKMRPIMAVMGQVLGVIVLWIILSGLDHAA